MDVESVFLDNPKLQDFIEFCTLLNEDITLLLESKPIHLFGLLVLWLSTQNIAVVLTNDEVISFFINPDEQRSIDMNCFLFEKDSSFVIINRKPKEQYLEIVLDAVQTLKYVG